MLSKVLFERTHFRNPTHSHCGRQEQLLFCVYNVCLKVDGIDICTAVATGGRLGHGGRPLLLFRWPLDAARGG